ncbi:hypothetical protein OG618_28560 [Kitasatospora sp. NBC_01246]|uniref:hypothetical protein n=1 Tax=Kitasatospora sp. NBC_01246 TaxID=2903570 RepID=UPI002E32F186|nr:hypothetical protein [Kitasatospora sp. NBC_01246]
MTVLHSRNADAADAKAAADAKDATDPDQNRGQAATVETGLRDELGRYAELGAFTLTAGTHAWYAAVDTVATPEDARAASTALAELRGSELQQTWEAVTALAADARIEVPGSVAVAALFAETLQRVHQTSATLIGAAYDADLDALVAATADRAWRRENGVKLSFLRVRGLRKQAAALVAGGRKVRPEELHEALASAKIERRAWAVLAPSGALPVPPADGPLAERTAAAFEAIGTALRDLGRLLPEHDLEAQPFPELIDLVERLAADEGTLYRLPTIRSLRTSLEEAGLADLLAELAAAGADRRAAEAAYGARQALAGGQRDGLTATEATPVEEIAAEEPVAEEPVEEAGAAEALVEETVVEEAVVEEAAVETETETEAEPVAADSSTEAEAEQVVAEPVTGADEPTAEEPVEARPLVVSLPAPSPAADDLVDVAPAVPAQAEAEPEVVEPEAEVVPAVEAEAEAVAPEVVEPEAAPAESVAEAAQVVEVVEVVEVAEVVEPTADVEPEVTESTAEVAEVVEVVEPTAEVEPEVTEPVAEVVEVVEVAEVVEPTAEVEPEVTEPVAEVVEVVEVVEVAEVVEPTAEVEPEVTEPVAEVAEVEEPETEAVPVAEVTEVGFAEAEPAVKPEPAPRTPKAPKAPKAAPAAGPGKPDFTPGRPVTAYSADELLAVVRWVDGDGVARSDEELLRAAMKELGFGRLGPRIKEALGAAVTAARG